jgi:hypothetical protein
MLLLPVSEIMCPTALVFIKDPKQPLASDITRGAEM